MKLSQIPVSPPEGFNLPGPFGQFAKDNPGEAPSILTQIISTAIAVMTIIAFIWFVIQFFIAAVQIISSGGDKAALTAAKSKLSTSVIGLVVVISAIFLIDLISGILGINILTGIVDFLPPTSG